MRSFLKQPLNLAYVFYAVILSVLFYYFSVLCYYSDSEIWLLTLSQKVFNAHEFVVIYFKFLFHLFIYLFSHAAPTENDVYTWARLGCATVALLSVGITAKLFSSALAKKTIFWPLFIFLLSSSLFFNQGFRIRADIFSYFFHILLLSFYYYKLNKKVFWYDHVIALTLNFLLIATGVKMIYFWVAQIVFCLLLLRNSRAYKKAFGWLLLKSHSLCLAVILLFSVLSLVVPQLPNIPYVIALALDFYVKKFGPIIFTPQPWDPLSFWYITHFLLSNPVHSMALLVTALYTLFQFYRFKHKKKSEPSPIHTAFGIYSFLLVIFTLIHNDRLPFFLAPMYLPILAFSFVTTFNLLERWKPKYLSHALFLVFTILTYRAFAQYGFHEKLNTNFYQKLAINTLDKYKQKYPNVKIYDIIGILPRKTDIYAFVGPGEEASKIDILHKIAKEKPDIILYVFKAYLLEPILTDYLLANMIPIEKDVWARGTSITYLRNFEYFQRAFLFNGRYYWVVPAPKEKYVYDLTAKRLLGNEVLSLDAHKKVTQSKAKFIAIPEEYMTIGFSDIAPTALFPSPEILFRFDTGY